MNTIRFTTTEPSSPISPTTPMTPSHAEALRYLAEVAAAQEWTDALNTMRTSPNLPHRSLSHIPARRRRHSRKARAGPPGLSAGVPADIRELVQKVMERQAEQASPEPSSRKPSLTLTPWSYPPIDEDAIAPPSPILRDTPVALAPFLDEAVMGDAALYDSELETELETETETELETEIESDAGPSIRRPRVRVVIDDSEPATPEFEAEAFKKWSCDTLLSKPVEPLVISTPTTLIPVHPELTPVASEPVDIAKLVDSVLVVEEEDDDDEWISGPPSYYTSPPESPHRSPAATPAATPACSPCATPAFTDDEYESEAESCEFFDVATDPIATHHLRNDLEIVRPFSPDAPDITFTPPTWEAFFECMPHQDEAYGLQLALPGSTPLGPAELEHNNLVLRARIRRNPSSGAQECMWRGKWTPCCWACGGAAEGMDTSLPASQRTGWFVLDNQRWLMIRG